MAAINTADNVLIVIIEDSDIDFLTLSNACRQVGITNPISRFVDGDQALDFLRNNGSDSPLRIGLILLDLNLLGRDGIDILKDIKSDDKLKAIPVLMLTGSSSRQDIDESYRNGANSYLVKPDDIGDIKDLTESIKDFWFEKVALPAFTE